MPTATPTNTISPPSRRALFGAGAAILAGSAFAATVNAAPATTRIADLNRRLQALTAKRNAMEETLMALPKGPEHDALYEAFGQNLDDCLAIQDQILTLPAESLEDAAVLAAIVFYRADLIDSFGGVAEDDAVVLSKELRGASASIVLAIVATAGLDIDRLGWGDMRRLCALRAPRGEASA